jgi:hypothetical protein
MADKKISQLTGASTPLAGTEVLPIVQSGSTVKVSSDDLTVKNIRSNATTGILQIAGPGAATTRVMTTPNANFTAARTDAAQTFTGNQTASGAFIASGPNGIPVSIQEITAAPSSATAAYVGVTTSAFPGGANGDLVLIPRTSAANDVRVYVGSGTPVESLVVQGSTSNVRVQAGNLVVGTAAKGIDFSANTGAAGETSTLLNWYEEGTWTPTLLAAGTNFTSVTYDAVTGGRYTRVGNMVHVQGRLRTDAVTVGSAAGDVCIGGLPFAAVANSGSTSNGASAISVGFVAANWAANRAPIAAQIAPGTSQIELYYRSAVDGGSTNLVPADVGTGADANTVYFAGTYICA